jgi:MFS family permease
MSDTSLEGGSLPSLATSVSARQRASLFYGWWIVLVSATGLFFGGVPLTVYSFSVFLKPLMVAFHAGRAAISLGYTLKLLTGAAAAPLFGWLIDRFGPRKVILLGTAVFGLTLMANRFVSGSVWQLYLFYILLGLTLHSSGPIPYSSVVSHWFDRRRGLALGLMMLGIGLGAVVVPPLVQQLISRWGWHAAYSILGCAVLLIPIPIVAATLKETPQQMGLQLDGVVAASAEDGDPASSGFSAAEARRTRAFWVMFAAFALVSFSSQGCLVHMSAMLTDAGAGKQLAALGASLMGGAVLLGRVGTGYLLDRLFAPRVAVAIFAASALGFALLLLGATPLAFAGAFLVGLALGAELDIIAYLTSRYFGLRAFGAIYSLLVAAFAVAGALGPLAMGVGFDSTGSYHGTLIPFLLAALIAAVLTSRLGPYRFLPEQPVERLDILPAAKESVVA